MDNGQLVEGGTHDELLNKNGIYKKLWSSQNSDIKLKNMKENTEKDEIIMEGEITYE